MDSQSFCSSSLIRHSSTRVVVNRTELVKWKCTVIYLAWTDYDNLKKKTNNKNKVITESFSNHGLTPN